MALSCEYTQSLIRVKNIKADLNFGKGRSSEFSHVISLAEDQLKNVFGMELFKLPLTVHPSAATSSNSISSNGIRKKRKTNGTTDTSNGNETDGEFIGNGNNHSENLIDPNSSFINNNNDQQDPSYSEGNNNGTSSRSSRLSSTSPSYVSNDMFILKSTLPPEYLDIVSQYMPESEKVFRGLVSIVISLIALRSGELNKGDMDNIFSEMKLNEYLQRTNFGGGSMDLILKQMQSKFYIEKETKKITDATGQSREFIKYSLGKRAKSEFSQDGIIQMCKSLLGDAFNDEILEQVKSQLKKTDINKK